MHSHPESVFTGVRSRFPLNDRQKDARLHFESRAALVHDQEIRRLGAAMVQPRQLCRRSHLDLAPLPRPHDARSRTARCPLCCYSSSRALTKAMQGYSIFAVVPNHSNGLPHCQADDAALTQSASASNGRAPHASSSRSAQSKKRRQSISDDAESGSDASEKRRRINGISDTAERLSEEDQMALAIAVSLEASKIDDRAPQNRSTSQPKTDEEDDSPSIEELRRRRLARFG